MAKRRNKVTQKGGLSIRCLKSRSNKSLDFGSTRASVGSMRSSEHDPWKSFDYYDPDFGSTRASVGSMRSSEHDPWKSFDYYDPTQDATYTIHSVKSVKQHEHVAQEPPVQEPQAQEPPVQEPPAQEPQAQEPQAQEPATSLTVSEEIKVPTPNSFLARQDPVVEPPRAPHNKYKYSPLLLKGQNVEPPQKIVPAVERKPFPERKDVVLNPDKEATLSAKTAPRETSEKKQWQQKAEEAPIPEQLTMGETSVSPSSRGEIDQEETIRLLEEREQRKSPDARYNCLEPVSEKVDFSLLDHFGRRYPHLALKRIISNVVPEVTADLTRIGASKISITFNPYLTQERVANFCKKWGDDFSNKVVLAYHGTDDKYIDSILRTNLKAGTRGLYGVGAYLSTHAKTVLGYTKTKTSTKRFLGFLVVVNRDTVLNQTSAQGVRRPNDYIVVKPDQTDALLPLFVVQLVVPSGLKPIPPSSPEMIDGIPFTFRNELRFTMRFGGKKRKKTRSKRHFSRFRKSKAVTASRLFR